MPKYAKKRYRKKNNRSTKVIVKKAVAQALKKIVEVKSTEGNTSSSAPSVATPLTQASYFDVADGTASNQKIGQKLFMQRIKIRFTLTTSDSDTVRVMYIFIKDDQMNSPLTAEFNAMNYNSFLPRNVEQKYKILYDRTFNMDADSHNVIDRSITLKINSNLTYNASSATVQKGQLRAYIFVRDAGTTSLYQDSYRTYFTDQ